MKYNDCTTYTECQDINPNVATDVDENGAWNYYLDNLVTGGVYDEESRNKYGLFGSSKNTTSNASLKSFNVNLPNLTNGSGMFYQCTNLTSFSSNLPKLTIGNSMFYNCKKFTSWDVALPNLTDGQSMFNACTGLTSFSADLSALTDGSNMFSGCIKLTSWNVALPNLTDGSNMFNGCTGLTSFSADLSALTNGSWMFMSCKNLTSLTTDLSNLTKGSYMFYSCILGLASVQKIANTINNLTGKTPDGTTGWGKIHIGIGNKTPNAEEETAFNTMASKGWKVYVNGSSTAWSSTASTNLTDEEQSASIPFYAKYIEVAEEHADYTSSDGKFYIIVGAQFIYGDDLSTYGTFTSFEHA